MSAGALIAAAGKYEAMEEFRPMMRLHGTSLIQKEIDTLRRAGISPIVVVTGYEAENLEKHLAHRGVVCLRNENYEKGEMLDSVKIGLAYLQSRCSKVLFLPADAPLFSVKTLEAVLESRAAIVLTACQGKKGHPILIRKSVIPEILAYSGDFGLAGALAASGALTETVEVEDPGILMEVSGEEEYREILDYEKQFSEGRDLFFILKIIMGKGEPVFGPGVADFLKRIDEKGSMLSACKEMGMSYSKGWKLIKTAEEELGITFLERQAGGADGGSSHLTEKGRKFLEAYLAMEADVSRAASAFFHMYFDSWRKSDERVSRDSE